MRGFTDKGIIIFPKYENFNARSYQYQSVFKSAVKTACSYFKKKGITLSAMASDEVALELNLDCHTWVGNMTPEDSFFVSKNCDGFANIPEGEEFMELYNKARLKYPAKRGLNTEDRFDIVLKRIRLISKDIISSTKFVIRFDNKSNRTFKVTSVEGDGRIIIDIDPVNFIATIMMSGVSYDPIFLLEDEVTSRPIYRWESI